jgi:phage tail sheath protein FI
MDRRNFFVGAGALVGTFSVFGLSTAQALVPTESALDRINIQRLLNHIKTSINEASQEYLFEYNDVTLRKAFRDWIEYCVEPYLENETIADYKVVCDETNNTQAIIENNEFVADVYVKPKKAVKYIQLTTHITPTKLCMVQRNKNNQEY